jgi:hypothetical protein
VPPTGPCEIVITCPLCGWRPAPHHIWNCSLLGEISITHTFIVTDPDGRTELMGSGIGVSCGENRFTTPAGFPPVALYALVAPTAQRRPANRLLTATARHYRAVQIGYLGQLGFLTPAATENLFHALTTVPYAGPRLDDRRRDQRDPLPMPVPRGFRIE